MRYLITFSCYGARLHGGVSGSVDRGHNLFGTRLLYEDYLRFSAAKARMIQVPYSLDSRDRAIVLDALVENCAYRHWDLFVAHVRTTHVHVVIEADPLPEKVMHSLKAYASRALNAAYPDQNGRMRWARHGSTRWLKSDGAVRKAIEYVVDRQGEAMALFIGEGV